MLTMEGWMNTMTIEYLINKDSDELFTLKLLNDKDCNAVLEYVKELASIETETWTSRHQRYISYDRRPPFSNSGNYEYEGTFRASNKIIDFYMYLIQKRIDDINKLEGCLTLQYEGVN